MKPAAGQTYTSATHPDLAVFVEHVSTPEPDGFFLVEICHPDSRYDMSAPSHELTSDEWGDLVDQHALILSD